MNDVSPSAMPIICLESFSKTSSAMWYMQTVHGTP